MPKLSSLVRATGTLTITATTSADTQTAVIGGKTYTFQTTLTNVDGNVLIGASITTMAANLAAAINLGTGAGTTYATAMTKSPHVSATSAAGVVTVTARVPGLIGNFIATTETLTNASWGAATLASGAGNIWQAIKEIRDGAQVNSDVLAALDAIDQLAGSEA
jgi:hypothetical protein